MLVCCQGARFVDVVSSLMTEYLWPLTPGLRGNNMTVFEIILGYKNTMNGKQRMMRIGNKSALAHIYAAF